jgi:hypothetical protein
MDVEFTQLILILLNFIRPYYIKSRFNNNLTNKLYFLSSLNLILYNTTKYIRNRNCNKDYNPFEV